MTLGYPAKNTSNLRLRIESLFEEQPHAIGTWPMLLGCAALCLVLMVHYSEVNHGLKTFLRWLS